MDPIVPRRYQKEPSSPVTTPQERNDIVSRGALRHEDRNLFSRAYHALPQMLGRSTYANLRANKISEAKNANYMDPIVPRRYQKEPSSPVTTPQERNDIVSRGALRHEDRNLFSRAYHALPQMLGRSTYANLRTNTISEATNANHEAAQSPSDNTRREISGQKTFDQNQARRMVGKARDLTATAGGTFAKNARYAEQVSTALSAPERIVEAAEVLEVAGASTGVGAPIALPALVVTEGARQGINASRGVLDGVATSLHHVAKRKAEEAGQATSRSDEKDFFQQSAQIHGANSEINAGKMATRTANALLPGSGFVAEVAGPIIEKAVDTAEAISKQHHDDAIQGRANALEAIHEKDTDSFARSAQRNIRNKKNNIFVKNTTPLREHAARIGRENLEEKRPLQELAHAFGVASGPKTSGALQKEREKQRSLHTQLTDHLASAATGTTSEDRETSEREALRTGQQWLKKRNTGFGRVKRLFEGPRYAATKELVSKLNARQESRKT